MGRLRGRQVRINRLLGIMDEGLRVEGLKTVPVSVLINQSVILALRTKGDMHTLDMILDEIEERKKGIMSEEDAVPAATYLTGIVSLLTKGEDQRDENEKSLQELAGDDKPIGKVIRS